MRRPFYRLSTRQRIGLLALFFIAWSVAYAFGQNPHVQPDLRRLPATQADLKQLADWARSRLAEQKSMLDEHDQKLSHVNDAQQRGQADVEHKLGGLRAAFDELLAERKRERAADFAGVQAVVLIPKVLDGPTGEFAGVLAPGAYRLIHQKLDDVADGKARITLLSERSEPGKFATYCQRLGTRHDQVSLTLFLPQHVAGAVKSLIVKKVEERVIGEMAGTRLYVLPERVYPEAYRDALDILDRPFPDEEPPEEWTLLHGILGVLSLLLGERAAGWFAYVRDRKKFLSVETDGESQPEKTET